MTRTTADTPFDASAETSDGQAPEPAPGVPTLLLLALGLGVVIIGQIFLATDLADPEIPGSIFDASGSKSAYAANAAITVVIGLAAFFLPSRLRGLALVPGFGLLAASLGGVLTFGGHLFDGVVVLLLMGTTWQLGRWTTTRLANPSLQGVPVIDVVLGAALLGLVVQVLGRLDAIAWWSVGALVVVVGLVGVANAGRALLAHRSMAWQSITSGPLAVMSASLIAVQLAWAAVYLSAPDIMFDAIYGKAYLPALWAHTGEIGPLTQTPALNLAGLTQMIATPGHVLGSEDTGRWLQSASWVLAIVTIWWWAGRRTVLAPVAALAVAVTPHLLWQNSTGYDDNVLILPVAALVIAMFRVIGDESTTRTVGTALLLGALGGAAIWFKLHLGILAVLFLAGWVLTGGLNRRLPIRTLAGVVGALIVAGPALILRWIDTGNPLFPAYNNIFPNDYLPPTKETYGFPFWDEAGTLGPLKLPYEAVVHAGKMSEAAPPGSYGLLVPIAVIGLLIGWRARERRAALILWGAFVLAFIFWYSQFRYLRYVSPMAIGLGLLLVAQLRGWRPGKRTVQGIGVAFAVAAMSFLPSTMGSFWNVPNRTVPYGAAFGRWEKNDYLRTVFPEKDALAAFQAMAPEGALAVSDPHERLFLTDRRLTVMYETAIRMTLLPPAPTNGDEAYAKLRKLGITWAIIKTDGASLANYAWLRLAIEEHGEAVFGDRAHTVYKLVDTPARPVSDQTCDPSLARLKGCWGGAFDTTPGLLPGESVGRTLQSCPGAMVAVGVTTAAAGQSAVVVVDPQGPTAREGYNVGAAPPGTTTWLYTTVPAGQRTVNIQITPGEGGEVERIVTGRLGPACPEPRAPGS